MAGYCIRDNRSASSSHRASASITPQRAKAVDFSEGYYDVSQGVVALKDSGLQLGSLDDAPFQRHPLSRVPRDISQPPRQPQQFGPSRLAVLLQPVGQGQCLGVVDP